MVQPMLHNRMSHPQIKRLLRVITGYQGPFLYSYLAKRWNINRSTAKRVVEGSVGGGPHRRKLAQLLGVSIENLPKRRRNW